MSNDVPVGFWRRSTSVLALSAGVAAKELQHKLRSQLASADKVGLSELRARIEQAKLIAESLGRLKGAFMKAGQLLSLDAGDLLPPEAVEILSSLQGRAEPVDFSVIRGVLERELGADALAKFESLDPTPAASASIGQVHRARAFGVPVAVKVQYPGVAESIDADIALVERLARGWLSATGREIDMASTFEELRSILHLEADYGRERAYLARFGALLAGDARFEVPRAVDALSSQRVLTMSWAEGAPLGEWVRTAPSREERTRFARAVLDLYCLEFFRWGLVQTDPNFGNFLVRPESATIVLLDFGATLEYAPEFRAQYVELLRAIERGDRRKIIDTSVAFELIDPRESDETLALFVEMLVSAVEPFNQGGRPFAFRAEDYAQRARSVIQRFTTSLRYSPPPRRLLFLHRKLGGIFQLLKRLDVELDLSPYWHQMVMGFEGSPSPSALQRPASPTERSA